MKNKTREEKKKKQIGTVNNIVQLCVIFIKAYSILPLALE